MDVTTAAVPAPEPKEAQEKIHWVVSLPFIAMHLAALTAFLVDFHWRDVIVCVALYYVRMFFVVTGYHRYFSHRSYRTGRVYQFLLALLATTSAQKGPLWWAAHHRHHHRVSDQADDVHSPVQKGFFWSHVGWILSSKYEDTRYELVRDLAAFPELRWLNRWHLVPPVVLAVTLFLIGGVSMLVWGFVVSTVMLWHGSFTINSLSHVFGRRRYKTTDTSRNNWLLALLTLGEGWHNNHHYHQNTANQGWFWWEVDFAFYGLKVLSWLGVVRDLRVPSDAVKYAHLQYTDEERARVRRPFVVLPAPQAAGEV